MSFTSDIVTLAQYSNAAMTAFRERARKEPPKEGEETTHSSVFPRLIEAAIARTARPMPATPPSGGAAGGAAAAAADLPENPRLEDLSEESLRSIATAVVKDLPPDAHLIYTAGHELIAALAGTPAEIELHPFITDSAKSSARVIKAAARISSNAPAIILATARLAGIVAAAVEPKDADTLKSVLMETLADMREDVPYFDRAFESSYDNAHIEINRLIERGLASGHEVSTINAVALERLIGLSQAELNNVEMGEAACVRALREVRQETSLSTHACYLPIDFASYGRYDSADGDEKLREDKTKAFASADRIFAKAPRTEAEGETHELRKSELTTADTITLRMAALIRMYWKDVDNASFNLKLNYLTKCIVPMAQNLHERLVDLTNPHTAGGGHGRAIIMLAIARKISGVTRVVPVLR